MITIYQGKTGQGKSLAIADTILELASRNQKWFEQGLPLRKIVSNMPLSKNFTDLYPDMFDYWTHLEQAVKLQGCDLIWDEMANQLDSRKWADLPEEVPIFLRQHEKRGVDIYGTTQNFAMVDNSLRRLTDHLYHCKKIIGSRRPTATKPESKYVWGLIWQSEVNPETFDENLEKNNSSFHSVLLIRRALVSIYDTSFEVPRGKEMTLVHREKFCPVVDCKYHNNPITVHR